MKKVSIKMANCYGIKQLEYVFDFEKYKNYLIYASNGMMKTSFTKTFSALHAGKKPKDEVYGKKTTCDVLNDDDPILGENIFVINAYTYTSINNYRESTSKDSFKEFYLLPEIGKKSSDSFSME